MKSVFYLLVLLFISINSYAQNEWQTIKLAKDGELLLSSPEPSGTAYYLTYEILIDGVIGGEKLEIRQNSNHKCWVNSYKNQNLPVQVSYQFSIDGGTEVILKNTTSSTAKVVYRYMGMEVINDAKIEFPKYNSYTIIFGSSLTELTTKCGTAMMNDGWIPVGSWVMTQGAAVDKIYSQVMMSKQPK